MIWVPTYTNLDLRISGTNVVDPYDAHDEVDVYSCVESLFLRHYWTFYRLSLTNELTNFSPLGYIS